VVVAIPTGRTAGKEMPRVGQADRIGQGLTLDAFPLIAWGTGDTRVVSRLRERVAAAQADIGAPDPLGHDRTVAQFVMEGGDDDREPQG